MWNMDPCLSKSRISTTCATAMLKNYRKCKYIFMFPKINSAQNGLRIYINPPQREHWSSCFLAIHNVCLIFHAIFAWYQVPPAMCGVIMQREALPREPQKLRHHPLHGGDLGGSRREALCRLFQGCRAQLSIPSGKVQSCYNRVYTALGDLKIRPF